MNFAPGDVELKTCSLAGIDIGNRVHHFSTFESQQKPYIAVKMVIYDSSDLLNYNLGMDGKTKLELEFSQPGQDPFKGEFIVMAIEEAITLENQRTGVYEITGYSPHMTNLPKVQKSYKNKTATNVAQDLIKTYLNPKKPLKIGAESKGMLGNDRMPFMINGIQIFKAIATTLLRAASTKDKSSAYVFYENKTNMVIDTMENLLKEAQQGKGKAQYFQRPMGRNWLQDQVDQNFTILALKEELRVDATSTIQSDNMSVKPFDLSSNELANKTLGELKKSSSYINLVMNLMRPKSHLPEVIPERKKYAGKLDTQSVTVQVCLNTEITVGDGIKLEVLAPPGDTDIRKPDRISEKPGMVTELRHIVRFDGKKPQGTTTFRLLYAGVTE
jgi:hypothetical protein